MSITISKYVAVINDLLKPFGARLVSSDTDQYDFISAIKRIQSHKFHIDNVIDIGGSDGNWSRRLLPYFPHASFLIIEPLIERASALRSLAKRCPNVSYEACAAGETNGGQATLNVSDDLDGSTVNGSGGVPRQVPVKTIDTIISERNLTGSFLLKFDTHGYEISILNGATDTLKKTSIIIMEVYNFKITERTLRFHEMCAYMEDLGFRCYDIAGLMLRSYDKSLWQMDLCFCRADAPIFDYNKYR
ncbi:FkbM family methyltransferase [uncultured Desulfosarcina sp.]|uniref:FkbM family methyltransferase n=1 Tax=uncultured Desulfosarcina sp. TaxID=218289 RepID=UPI0029C93182|nr:FkbM family methyltransferase [uncultured Desulfosarcina sp.]